MVAPLIGLPFFSHSLVIMVLYIWSRRNPYEQLHLYGLFRVSAGYLAYILLGLSVAMGQSPLIDLLGIAIGHVYYFLTDVIPVVYNIKLLKTPFFISMFFAQEQSVSQEEWEEEHDGAMGHVAAENNNNENFVANAPQF